MSQLEGLLERTDSLILDFPPEILCHIFDLTLPNIVHIHQYPDNMEHPTAPWRLATVCKQWRSCALGYPKLWSSIDINMALLYYKDTSASVIYPIAALETQLLRSADVPLRVAFFWPDSSRVSEANYLLTLLRLLVRTSYRWERFSFTWGHPNPEILHVLEPIRGRLALLQHLEFHQQLLFDSIGDCDLFAAAPCLQEIFLTNWHHYSESSLVAAPWAQITRLRAKLKPPQLLELLRAAPNLVECSLGLTDTVVPFPATPPVVLPLVQRMYASDTAILRLMNAPQLHYLRVHRPLTADVASFIHRSNCLLTALTVEACHSTEFLHLLRTIPNLLKLKIDFWSWPATVDLAEILVGLSSMSPLLCPDLTALEIVNYSSGTPQDYEAMIGMISSRWPATALKYVRIFTKILSEENPVPGGFQALQDKGLDIVVAGFQRDPNAIA
ncbi:hypothetical protein C8R43DRAFT_991465 [Mycena crocata]|nr:hypothetical protein C8R43DRAFT_991465 [Mycena crocata]